MKEHSLISIGQLSDSGYLATFDATSVLALVPVKFQNSVYIAKTV
jgi:hypothetical protein